MSPRLSDLFLSSQSDERLVALARAGHERAFAAIVERYRAELHALARRLCSDGRGEDIVQQAFLSAFSALRAGTEVKHLRGWLYQIVRNAATRSAGPICVPLDGTAAMEDSLEEVVQQRALAMTALSELARLPARQRQAMIGTALDGRARAEIATSMGLSEGAVRQLVHRARATLRSAVTALTPWPLARWLAALGPGTPGGAELAAGAGAASSGGLVVKLGALLASGTFLTGAAVVDLHHAPVHPAGARAAVSRHSPLSGSRARPLMAGLAAAQALPVSGAAAVRPALAPRKASRSPGQGAADGQRRGSRETFVPGSGARSAGQRVGRRDGVGAGRSDQASSAAPGGGDTSRHGSGSAGSGNDGGRGAGTQGNTGLTGGGDSRQGSSGATRSDGGGDAQMASASNTPGSAFGGTSSSHDSSFTGGSGSGDGSGSGATSSGSFSGGGGGSGSGDGGTSSSGSGSTYTGSSSGDGGSTGGSSSPGGTSGG
jgi:RNA polymerase sigma factor (sigma-70 family)